MAQYRESAGLEVESETINADQINSTLALSKLYMRKGLYSNAVTSLENVTEYCSQNSVMGSQIFIELAMAYEAVGDTSNATILYTELAKSCKQPKVKKDARTLLAGLQAMDFLKVDRSRNEGGEEAKKANYIDTSSMNNVINSYDSYSSSYINTAKGGTFYEKLTENVVRSKREVSEGKG